MQNLKITYGAHLKKVINLRKIDKSEFQHLASMLNFDLMAETVKSIAGAKSFLNIIIQAGLPEYQQQELCDKLNFADLGKKAAGFANIMNFIRLAADKAKLTKKRQREFCEELNYIALGENAYGFSSIQKFLQLIREAGVSLQKQKQFFTKMNFSALGERAKGFSTVRSFLELCVQAEVPIPKQKDFCEKLDFVTLGNEATNSGFAVIVRFLKLVRQAGASKSKQKEFCNQLCFPVLGEQAATSGSAVVRTFINLVAPIRIEESKWIEFFSHIDFKRLGEQSFDAQKCSIKYDAHFLLINFTNLSALSSPMASDFIQGIGEENLNSLIKAGKIPFSSLVILDLFLREKCKSSDVQMEDYLKSFSRVRLKDKSFAKSVYDGINIISEKGNLIKYLSNQTLNLRNINTLIYNLQLFDRGNIINNDIIPVISSFPKERWQSVFENSDLRDISNFMKDFDLIKNTMPFPDISFEFLRNENCLNKFLLKEWAYLLFAFYYIHNRKELPLLNNFINGNADILLEKLQNSKLFEIDLFCWNLLMASNIDSPPALFHHREFQKVIDDKISREFEDLKAIMGLIGTMTFANIPLSGHNLNLNNIQESQIIAMINECVDKPGISLLRIMRGVLTKPEIISNLPIISINLFFNSLNNNLDIPRQQEYVEQVKAILR